MFRHWNHILIAVLAASSLVLQPVSAGVFPCASCCDSNADDSCCQTADQLACCSSRDTACCQVVRTSCCGETSRSVGCHCGENETPPVETPLPDQPTAESVLESLTALSLTTWDCSTLQLQPLRIAFERSPIAHAAPPAKQLLLCVWRT